MSNYAQHLHPLPEKENNELLLKAKAGDRDAKELFFSHNYRLMIYIAKKFQNNYKLSEDDRISAAQMGFLKAFNTFDPERNIKFATYATRCMENEILMLLRKDKDVMLISLDEPLHRDQDGNELLLADITPAPEPSGLSFEERENLKDVLDEYRKKKGHTRNVQMLHMRIVDEMSQKEVAQAFNLSQSYISRMEKRALKQLHAIANKILVERPKIRRDLEMAGRNIDIEKLKYCLESTGLSDVAIAKVIGCSPTSVFNYRKKFKAGEMDDIRADVNVLVDIPQEMLMPRKKVKREEKPVAAPTREDNVHPAPPLEPPFQMDALASLFPSSVSLSFTDLDQQQMAIAFKSFLNQIAPKKRYKFQIIAEEV